MAGRHIPDNDFIMQGRYKVVTLCGSTRFKDDFFRVQKELTLEGNIVISVGLFGHSGDDEVWTAGTKEMLDDMHFSKIDMADEIFVVNPGGYVGESTAREIGYALSCGKPVRSLCPLPLEKYAAKEIDSLGLRLRTDAETMRNHQADTSKRVGIGKRKTSDAGDRKDGKGKADALSFDIRHSEV